MALIDRKPANTFNFMRIHRVYNATLADLPVREIAPINLFLQKVNNFHAVAISDTEIDLSWEYDSIYHTGFTVEQSTNGGSTWTALTAIASTARTLSITGLTTDTSYTYRIRSFNTTQVSEWSELVNTYNGGIGLSFIIGTSAIA